MMTEEERLTYLLERRVQLDKDMRDAEILFGLLRKTLSFVDEELKQFQIDLQKPLAFSRTKGIHINAKRTTAEERYRVVNLHNDGMSLAQIGNIMKLSKTTVIRILKKEGEKH